MAALSKMPSNVEYEVRRNLAEFSNIVKEDMKGDDFRYYWNQLAAAFRTCLVRQMKPKFNVTDRTDINPKAVISLDSDDESGSAIMLSTSVIHGSRKRPAAGDPLRSGT